MWFDSQRGRDSEAAGEPCSPCRVDSHQKMGDLTLGKWENGDFTWGYNGSIQVNTVIFGLGFHTMALQPGNSAPFFEFQAADGRVFWDRVMIVTTVTDDSEFPCSTWATWDLA